MSSSTAAAFAPFADQAALLLPHALPATDDGAHDLAHLARVWTNAYRIGQAEGANMRQLLAAVLMHDCVAVEKSSPLRSQASRMAAEQARSVLSALGWLPADIDVVAHAIEAHSHSAGIAPQSCEARVLQDADRLDALGVVGAARCFYVGGRLGRPLYDPADPAARDRAPDDVRFTLDHFLVKLFKLSAGFQTETGRALARQRHDRLVQLYQDFLDEIGGAAVL